MGMQKKSLTTLVAMLAASTALVACSTPEQRVERYTKAGAEFFENGDKLRANIQYRNALQIDENHIPALEGLIAIAESDREYPTMYGLLQQLIRLDPNNVNALVKSGNIELLASDEVAAQETADKALALEPGNLDAQALRASVLYKVGDTANAVRIARQIMASTEANHDAVGIIVADKVAQNDLPGALQEVESALAKEPNHVLISLMKIELLTKLNRAEEADAVFRNLIANNPEDISYRQTYSRYLIRLGKMQEAREALRAIIPLAPDDIESYLNIVRLTYFIEGSEPAISIFKEFIESRPNDHELHFSYATFLTSQKKLEDAADIYKKYSGKNNEDTLRNRADVALAGIALTNKENVEAKALIDRVLERDESNPDALVRLATLKIQDEEYDSALIDLRNALQNEPDNHAALILMSTALEKQGDIDFADKQITLAFEGSNGSPEVANAYAAFLLRHNKFDRAEKSMQDSLSRFPNNIEGLKLLATAQLVLQDFQGAEETAQLIRARSNTPDPAVMRILGSASIGQGDFASAIDRLTAANEEQPLASQPLTTLIEAYLEEGRNEEAKALLNNIVSSNPKNYDARLLLARVYFAENNVSDGVSTLNQALSVDPQRFESYDLLYKYYIRSGQLAEASALIYEGLEKFDDNVNLRFYEADFLLIQGRYEDAIAVYERLHEQRPQNQIVANNYASLLLDNRTDEESLSKALRVAETIRNVELPGYQDTLAWAYYKNGDLDNALLLFRRAVKDWPKAAFIRYHLGAVYLAAGNKDSARTELQMALELGGQNFRHAEATRELLAQI